MVVVLLTFVPISSNDFWLQSAIGRMIWMSGEIPRAALFPFTEAKDFPFHAHEWLASVLFHLLHERLGHENLIFVKGMLGLALFGLCLRLAYRVSGDPGAALVISLLAIAVANFRHFLRPELFALLFVLIVLSLFHEYRSTHRRRYLLATLPVALLWANCHGSFVLAPLLAGIFAAGAGIENWRAGRAAAAASPYALCGAAMALVILASPNGLELYRFAWQLQGADFVRTYIFEWMPTFSRPFVETRGFWAFVVYFTLGLALLWKRRHALSATVLLLFIVFGTLALHTQRHITFFAVVSVYPLSVAVAGGIQHTGTRRALPALALVLAACVGLLLRYGNMHGGFPYFVTSNNFSPMLIEFVERNRLEGNVLNSYALGAELVYRFYPRLRPAIDSRVDVYGEQYFLYVRSLQTDERALREFVDRYSVSYMLLLWPEFDNGIRAMTHLRDDGWRIVFADHKVVLLGRP